MRRLYVIASTAAFLAFASPASASVIPHLTANPFSLRFAAGTKTLTAQNAPLGYVLANGSRERTTRLLSTTRSRTSTSYVFATSESGRTARLTLSARHGGAHVTWSVTPTDDVDHVSVNLAATASQHFLGAGERRATVDLSRQIVDLKVWNVCGSNAPAPWFLSTGGYGVLVDSASVGTFAFPGAVNGPAFDCAWGTSPCPVESNVAAVQICERGPTVAYDVFGGDFQQLQRSITSVAGRPVQPAPSQLELIKWRDEVKSAAELLDDVRQLRSRDIPIGWELLDNPWESCRGSLTFDRVRLGDPAALIASLRAQGVKLMLWISPTVDLTCGGSAGYGRILTAPDGYSEIDLTAPADYAEFERRLQALLALGVAGFKGDRGDDIDLEHTALAGGSGEALHNLYPVLFERAAATAAAAAGLAPIPTLFRAGWMGSATLLSGFWSGDLTGDVHGLRAAIRSAATAGLGGYSTWGTDTGGYIWAGPQPNVFVRWSQLSAISPIFEVGAQGEPSTFWDYGTAVTSAFRDAAILHYELFPYLYGLTRVAHASGIPVLRSLAFGYPSDRAAWQHELELTVGKDLLAAPVDASGASVDFPVYLPKGGWVDVFTGTSHPGGRSVVRKTRLATFPLYLRAGAAIRFNLRATNVWSDPWQTNDLEHAGRVGWLYAPAGKTKTAGFSAVATRRGLQLAVSGRNAAQVLVLGRRRPAQVVIDGRRVAAGADLRSAAVGWRRETGQSPGVLLKLRHGSRVTIRWR